MEPPPAKALPSPPPRDLSRSRTDDAQGNTHCLIDSLPIELLTQIFLHAPAETRLNPISLVCKRWRRAALHAVTTLARWFDGRHQATRDPSALVSALQLLPSLTSLTLIANIPHYVFPTTLRRLRISVEVLRSAAASAHCGLPTFLSQHFPGLTRLEFNSQVTAPELCATEIPPLMGFLSMHSTQIRCLDLVADEYYLSEMVKHIRWPELRVATLQYLPLDHSSAFLDSMPHLTELTWDCDQLEAFMSLPDRCLTSLTALHYTYEFEPAVIERVHRHPRLRLLSSFSAQPPELLALYPDFFARTLVDVFLRGEPWLWLRNFPAVEWLRIGAQCPPVPSPLPLPHLRRVTLGSVGAGELYRVSEALLLASFIAHLYPNVCTLELYVTFEHEYELIHQRIEELAQTYGPRISIVLYASAAALDQLPDLPSVRARRLRLLPLDDES